MKNSQNYEEIIHESALAAGALGIPGSFFPPADMAGMAIIWFQMFTRIAEESGHEVDGAFAAKFVTSITTSAALYVGGSKLANALLHLIPFAGNTAAAVTNAGFNYIYTERLGRFLVGQFDRPDVDLASLIGAATTAVAIIFALPTNEEADIAQNSMDTYGSSDPMYVSENAVGVTDLYTSNQIGTPVLDTGPLSQWVDAITQSFHTHHIPVFAQENLNNAACHIASLCTGNEVISYDPAFINHAVQTYGPEAGIGIMAHEVGHDYYGVQIPNYIANWDDERRADYFAGQVLAKFNLNPNPLLEWLRHEAVMPDERHPGASVRINDVLLGYRNSGGQLPIVT
jgi:uncharacterized protein (DUF697 family)